MSATRIFMTLATIGFFVLSGTANATTVVNLNSSATLFFDDYEGLGTNVSHTNMVDTSGDYDPVATTGTWSIYEADAGGYACQVTDSTAGSAPVADPGAYQGNNYLRFDENPDLSVPEVQFAEQTTIGDTIHFESMMYLAYGVGAPAIIAKDGNAAVKFQVRVNLNGSGKIQAYNGSGFVDLSVNYTPMTWQKWEIDYDIGASTYALTIDGDTDSDAPVAEAGNLARLTLVQFDGPHPIYMDAVPEPGTLALVVFGGLSIMVFGRRLRK